MLIHSYEFGENLVTLAAYGPAEFLRVTVIHEQIDTMHLNSLKDALIEYKLAVTRVRKTRKGR